MSEQAQALSSAEDIIRLGRAEVETRGGLRFLIWKLSPAQVAYFLLMLPDLSVLDLSQVDRDLSPEQVRRAEDAIRSVIVAGVLKPKLCADPEQGPTPADLPYQDQLDLFSAILAHSGFKRESAEEVLPLSEIRS